MIETDSLINVEDVKTAAFSDEDFEALISAWGLDEVRLAFANLASALLFQFTQRSGTSSGWNRTGAGVIKVKADARLNDLKARIADRNRDESASVNAYEKRWSTFAESVARELYLRDPAALAAIPGPGDGGVQGDEWLHNRLARQAEKAAKRNG